MARLPNPNLSSEANAKYKHLEATYGSLEEGSNLYMVLLNHPELAEKVAQLGDYLRFSDKLPTEVREVTILLAARQLVTPYNWIKHFFPLEKTTLSTKLIDAIQDQLPLSQFSPVYPLIEETVILVLSRQNLPASLYEELRDSLGIDGVIELVLLIGFYSMLASLSSAFEV